MSPIDRASAAIECEVRSREIGALAGKGVLDEPGVALLVTAVDARKVVLGGQ